MIRSLISILSECVYCYHNDHHLAIWSNVTIHSCIECAIISIAKLIAIISCYSNNQLLYIAQMQ